MNERTTSRVTLAPMLESRPEPPRSGWRNGTRANAAAICWARSSVSIATTGAAAVRTSGRSAITIGLLLVDSSGTPRLPAAPTCSGVAAETSGSRRLPAAPGGSRRQPSVARASLKVGDGRITAAARASSGR